MVWRTSGRLLRGLRRRLELAQIGPMVRQGAVDLALLQRDLAQAVGRGAELQSQIGIVRSGSDRGLQQSAGALGLGKPLGEVSPFPYHRAERQRGSRDVAPCRGSAVRAEQGFRDRQRLAVAAGRRLRCPQPEGSLACRSPTRQVRGGPARAAARGRPPGFPRQSVEVAQARRAPGARAPGARRAGHLIAS